jgi:hypothetical protein
VNHFLSSQRSILETGHSNKEKRYTDTVIRSGTGTVSEEEVQTLSSEVVQALYQKKRYRHCRQKWYRHCIKRRYRHCIQNWYRHCIRGCITGTEQRKSTGTVIRGKGTVTVTEEEVQAQ